ncbi:MAG: hypothetical protein ACFFEV_09730, partial [Candidatus Thorarchaeota archaeon]
MPDSIRKEILVKITPSKEELGLQNKIIDQLKEALQEKVKSTRFQYSFIEPQGSTGKKQTQLRGSADIDLFVALKPEDYPEVFTKAKTPNRKAIDKIMSSLVSNWFEPAVRNLEVTDIQRAFSQHPFLSLKMHGIDIDILGSFDIDAKTLAENGPITAVDRTVHHSSYVADRMNQRKRDDARILKSFVRACHAYGDTCAVGRMGLTGVTLEILVLITPNLESAFESLHRLDTDPIDPLSRSIEDLRKIPSFRDDNLFLIDPTDHNRNMASSFSSRSYAWVQYRIERVSESLRLGDTSMIVESFIESPVPHEAIPKWIADHSLAREFQSDGKVHYTILRDKLHRLARKIVSEMTVERTGESRFGEILTEVYFNDKRYALGMFVESPKISKTFDRKGPPIDLEDAVESFKESHPEGVIEKDGILYIREDREWTSSSKMFDSILESNSIEGLEIQNNE